MKRLFISAALLFALCAAHAQQIRVLAYGDSNTFGWQTDEKGVVSRIEPAQTWPGEMQKALGNKYEVIVEGLSGRTTDADRIKDAGSGDIKGALFNGGEYLPVSLSSHMPLDIVIVMLGTNDLNREIGRDARQIATGMGRLADIVTGGAWQNLTGYKVPKVLLVAPPAVNVTGKETEPVYPGGDKISREVAGFAEKEAREHGAAFYDASQAGSCAEGALAPDGIHLTVKQHKDLGAALAVKVCEMTAH